MRVLQNSNYLILLSLFVIILDSARLIHAQGKDRNGNGQLLNLDDLFQEFVEVAHLKEVLLFAQAKIVEGNTDMERIVDYMNCSDFRTINDYMWKSPPFNMLYHWLLENRLYLDQFYTWLYEWLGWGEFPYRKAATLIDVDAASSRPKRSLKSLCDEMTALVPYSDVLTWTLEQIAKKNPDMIGLLTKLGDESTQKVWNHLYECEEFLELRCILIAENFNIESWEQMISAFLDWEDFHSPKCSLTPV